MQYVTGPVAVLFDRLGPYHVARIRAAAAAFPTIAIEFGADTSEYAWERVSAEGDFPRHTVVAHGRSEDVTTRAFTQRLFSILNQTRPSAVAIPGWAHRGALLALIWAMRTNTPVIMMSESQRQDAPRARWREYAKARVVALCTAGLVGGRRHSEYLQELGMPAQAIFTGYDIVDNAYFAERADATRAHDMSERTRLGLPARFFLASSRFVPKKNLFTLLRAYLGYRQSQGQEAAKLVLLGDGPLKDELLRLRASLGLERDVLFPGFQQYGSLPAYYGLAEAFVHASTTEQWGLVVNEAMAAGLPIAVSRVCGCTPELVIEGENGFSFDPLDAAQLTHALRLITFDPDVRARMGQRSRAIISRWSPARFAQQMGRARDVAYAGGRRPAGTVDRAMLKALTLR